MFVVITLQDYVYGICVLLLLVDIFGLSGVPLGARVGIAVLLALIMLFISGQLIRWIVGALIFISVFLFTLIAGIVRHFYRKLTA